MLGVLIKLTQVEGIHQAVEDAKKIGSDHGLTNKAAAQHHDDLTNLHVDVSHDAEGKIKAVVRDENDNKMKKRTVVQLCR